MDLRYTDDQQAYREAVREFSDEVLAPMARTQYDFGRPLARKEIQAMAAALERYELATVPPLTEAGGCDLIYLAMFIEEISRIDLTFSLFMVGAGTEGCECRPIETIGMDGVALCEVTLTNCRVPLDADLTPGSGGLRAALRLVEQARLKIVFMAVGLCQAALDLAVGYAKERRHSGRPIASLQLVQEMLAEMSTLTECARLLGYQAASTMMAGKPARAEVSRAKAYATEAATRVTSLGIQVHGAMGLTRGYPAEKLFRDARMLTIPDGTTEIHKLVLGRELTGINALH
jgi:alkylation response protein AidB-like acyl-CoA dehydrogenase